MLSKAKRKRYYQALLAKDPVYEGLFYIGVITTDIFCRPTCPARKPKFEHCEFFTSAEAALLAGFRPCKRCQPLSHPRQVSELVQKLVAAVEENPEKRWKERDFRAISIHAATARRQFKKRFGMTFVEYARARRMGIAMKQIRKGLPVIDAQITIGYESSSGFRDAFARILGKAPSSLGERTILKAAWLDTPLGPMVAMADEEKLYLLEFVNRRGLEREVDRLRQRLKCNIIPGESPVLTSIEKELNLYFAGKLQKFTTPLFFLGSDFQKKVWQALQAIPYGETRSYADIAKAIKQPSAFRAVARANGANQLCLIVPCHRVINSNGELGGYGGGLERKNWLITHEKNND